MNGLPESGDHRHDESCSGSRQTSPDLRSSEITHVGFGAKGKAKNKNPPIMNVPHRRWVIQRLVRSYSPFIVIT